MGGLLAEKVIVVTGGAQHRSIGDAIARRAAEEGARVVLTSRSEKSAAEAAARLVAAGHRALGVACDLTRDEDAARVVDRALREFGRVDGIAHNAGYPVTDWSRGFLDVPPEEYARVFDVDVVGAIRLTRHALPRMVERGAGALVFTSSTASLAGYEYLHEFAPAKAGLLGIMRDLAVEFGPKGVRSNAVAYGNVKSEATWSALTPEERAALEAESPLRRWAEPWEAAGATLFLLSDLASFVNGQTLVVDGGAVTR